MKVESPDHDIKIFQRCIGRNVYPIKICTTIDTSVEDLKDMLHTSVIERYPG